MSRIPEATPITLAQEERAEPEGLARSTKSEHRMRQRGLLMAADGVATRAIGRTVGCTTGTASKWWVRYAEQPLAGLDETGDRAAEPKYTATTDSAFWLCWISRRPRAMPAGRGRCWLRRSATSMCSILALPARPEDRPRRARIVVREQRSGVRRQGRRCGRALYGAARERDRHLCR